MFRAEGSGTWRKFDRGTKPHGHVGLAGAASVGLAGAVRDGAPNRFNRFPLQGWVEAVKLVALVVLAERRLQGLSLGK